FDITNTFAYGVDVAKFEDILKYGFVKGEDCFNSIDDDGDGNIDCNDWDCQYSDKCTAGGVNAASYVDTKTPLVTGVNVEEYPDAALITYTTNKPANGTLKFYLNDSKCSLLNTSIYDKGILRSNRVRQYNLWHSANIFNGTDSLSFLLSNQTTYYYKLYVCDSNNKCATSRCSNFTTASSLSNCAYCNFVAKIKVPSAWDVYYDSNQDGVYDHRQGYVCGPNSGMKINYTAGRRLNVKINSSDGTAGIIFINASISKTSLNDKTRTITSSGFKKSSTYMGLDSTTRDKIVNNLHAEVCQVIIPTTGANCTKLFHCDDSGANCVDRTADATLISNTTTTCTWQVPYCEFSVWGSSSGGGGGGSSGGGSSGGGGGGGGSGKKAECNDLKDNDNDLLVDYPNDPGCSSSTDNSEVDIICKIKWTCSEWGSCITNKKIRSCFDINDCETKKQRGEVANIDSSDVQPETSIQCNITEVRNITEREKTITGEVIKEPPHKKYQKTLLLVITFVAIAVIVYFISFFKRKK
ncbi:hypothetical protein HYX19_01755, partial [Candidatus Woesearchaeota archaeon]|nr:hypothetical protein [Candidatus Woesearchaeota archaeon]